MVSRSASPRSRSAPSARSGIRRRRLQQPDQPLPERLDLARIEQVGPVVEPQLQLARPAARSASADNAWRRGPRPARAAARRRRRAAPGRRGRPDSSRTPRACRTARPGPPPAGSRRARCADAPSAATGSACVRRSSSDSGSCGGKPHPQRQRVDEQPHHVLDAGKLRRPPRHRHPEHHVVAPAQPAEQQRPTPPASRVFSVTACSRAARLSPRQRSAERKHHGPASQLRAPARAHRGCRPPWTYGASARAAALLKPRQRLPPRRKRRRAVLPRHARQILAVRRHPRQRRHAAAPRIGLQQLPHQDRRRPAVHQKVMVADQQPVPLRRKPISANRSSGGAASIEPLQPVGCAQLRETAARCARRITAPTDRSAATAPRPAAAPPAPDGRAAHARSPTAGSHAARPPPAAQPRSAAASSAPSSSSSSCTV